jgi:hypothetical protein
VSVNQAIAQFDERRFDGRRHFELFSDSVRVSGSTVFGTRFEERVDLDLLSSNPDKLWTRHAGFWSGIGMAVVFWVLPMGFANVLSSWWKGLFWGWAVTGVLLALVTARRIEWAVFRNSSGVRVLAIARAGPDRARFDEFVGAIQLAVTKRQSNAPETDT